MHYFLSSFTNDISNICNLSCFFGRHTLIWTLRADTTLTAFKKKRKHTPQELHVNIYYIQDWVESNTQLQIFSYFSQFTYSTRTLTTAGHGFCTSVDGHPVVVRSQFHPSVRVMSAQCTIFNRGGVHSCATVKRAQTRTNTERTPRRVTEVVWLKRVQSPEKTSTTALYRPVLQHAAALLVSLISIPLAS